ncbi:MAG: cell division protein FtsZ [Flavobacteriales bacterium]|nr:cell division protein FtsZ [Flavobacteriales bacterium]
MENTLKFDLPINNSSIIKVIGVGGGGSNAVNYMYEQGIKGVDFIVCNTDAQALDKSPVPIKVQLGNTLTEGRGAGSIPEVGRNAAIESLEEVKALLSENTNMVFITAGMGGGTGTGAAPVIARVAKDMGILTVGIVTVPFMFEGRKRSQQADLGLKEIRESVDTLLIIRNDKLRELYGNLTLKQAFSHADEVLCTAAKGIAEVITLIGTVNVDMNDVKTVMKDSGVAIMGSGRASGEGRAKRAVQAALESPLLNDNDINGANFILLNITYGQDELLMDEISEITDYIQEQAGMGAEVIWGYGQDDSLGEDVCATVIATGFAAKTVDHVLPVAAQEPKKMWLETEGAKEVTAKVEKPVTEVPEVKNEIQEEVSNEPFIKVVDQKVEFEFDVTNHIENVEEESVEDSLPELSSLKLNIQEEQIVDQPVYHDLGSDLGEIVAKQSDESPSDTLVHKETQVVSDRPNRTELMARNKEREMRIREFTIKLKTPNGLNELESEPAYARKKISLDSPRYSEQSNVSRYSLNESTDENGQKKIELRDNPFLHDNVD